MKEKLIKKFKEGYDLYLDLLSKLPDYARVEFVRVGDIKPGRELNDINETTYKNSNWESFKKSLKENGTYWPIFLHNDYTVVEGGHRVKAFKEIDENKKVYCIIRDEDRVVVTRIKQIRFKINTDFHLNRPKDQWEQEKKKRMYNGDHVEINYYNDYEYILHKIVFNLGKIDTILRTQYNYVYPPSEIINFK
jgi:hypothetical protein